MCEKSKCQHQTEGLCSCPPVKNRGENLDIVRGYDGEMVDALFNGLKEMEMEDE